MAGTIDYLTFTGFYFPAGVVDFSVTLWLMLKSKRFEGRKFRRQYSIGNYIVDFCCPSEKLIIELDGYSHGEYQTVYKDEIRDNYLKSLGFTVLRFENRFVFQEPEYLTGEISKILNKNRISDAIE